MPDTYLVFILFACLSCFKVCKMFANKSKHRVCNPHFIVLFSKKERLCSRNVVVNKSVSV